MSELSSLQEIELDAQGVYYRDLNARLRQILDNQPCRRIAVRNVCGQRYIGTAMHNKVCLELYGTPGNDLGAFMDGPRIIVHGNAQDGCGNTLNAGEIIVHGRAGDITGYSMRGGKLFIQGDVGYRAGIHMKASSDQHPTLVIGGTPQPFLGEYMAGGVVLVLGLTLPPGEPHKANYIGTGMHGGVIYLRGQVAKWQLGAEVGVAELQDADWAVVRELVAEFTGHFGGDAEAILAGPFQKLYPLSLRPYGNLYAY
jgi:glutamate synthase domain-containing protein 3